jgi:hypothetical protein
MLQSGTQEGRSGSSFVGLSNTALSEVNIDILHRLFIVDREIDVVTRVLNSQEAVYLIAGISRAKTTANLPDGEGYRWKTF